MRDVYSKAELCIAATGAENGDVGLFLDRDTEQVTPVMVEATWSREHYLSRWLTPGFYLFGFNHVEAYEAIDAAPLNQRAWVAQERFLSPRILHFTQSLLFWECQTFLTHENDAVLENPNFQEFQGINYLREQLIQVQRPKLSVGPMQDVTLPKTTPRELYNAWWEFLADYTSCGITKESDILVALVGVADHVGHATNDCLVAGLWKANFIEELCWRSDGNISKPSVWRAPSWSWASLSSRCDNFAYSNGNIDHQMAAVVELYISTKSSGEVEQGSALVECRLVPAAVQYRGLKGHDRYYNACTTLGKKVSTSFSGETYINSDELISVQLDVAEAPFCYADQAVDVQLLVLLKNGDGSMYWMTLDGICVVGSKKQEGAFERVGYFHAKGAAAMLLLAAYHQARVQVISLV